MDEQRLRLGQAIRAARERKGWTQAELGKKVGAARETVGNWETGTTTPRNKIAALEETLGVRLSGGDVGGEQQDSATQMSIPEDAIEGLSPRGLREMKRRLEARAYIIRRELDRDEQMREGDE